MKKLLLTVVALGCVGLLSQAAFAQCTTPDPFKPYFQIQGDLLCPDLSTPTAVTLVEFNVDSIPCANDSIGFGNIIWTYPHGVAGYYKLEFQLDNSTDHTLNICVQTSCDDGAGGTMVYTGGFSSDGTTPANCSTTADFPAGSGAVLAHVVTPVQLSSFTSSAN